MRLSRAQKTNLLILAGFVPMVRNDGANDMRITNTDRMVALTRNEDNRRGEWQLDFVDQYQYDSHYIASCWDHMDVSSIPPHVLDQAINPEK